ncbi:SCO2522 family protein [Parafrankia discariae]|uniref:SCO2522 family protein n=1 Tax=Parafrankia discariae TaxID=365528 RepID=UPI0003633E3C|nr:SCO2522 family protein [Parafrankia discariae]
MEPFPGGPASSSGAAVFRETSAVERTAELPLAQLSVEVGHFYPEDLTGGDGALAEHFRRIAPWVDRPRLESLAGVAGRTPRVSTCLLIDDYSDQGKMPPPAVAVPELLAAAGASGVTVDYIARESACTATEHAPLARIVEGALVVDPPYGANGSRPPPDETGWLCNGARSPSPVGGRAMGAAESWRPPTENGSRRHSVFLDVELWSEHRAHRVWSCAFLATVWQLLRLGLLRAGGETVVRPVAVDLESLPDRWADLPAIGRLTPAPAPFCAYRTFSLLDTGYLPIEHAVRVILGQVGVDSAALSVTRRRAAAEGVPLPPEPADRLSYLFLGR